MRSFCVACVILCLQLAVSGDNIVPDLPKVLTAKNKIKLNELERILVEALASQRDTHSPQRYAVSCESCHFFFRQHMRLLRLQLDDEKCRGHHRQKFEAITSEHSKCTCLKFHKSVAVSDSAIVVDHSKLGLQIFFFLPDPLPAKHVGGLFQYPDLKQQRR